MSYLPSPSVPVTVQRFVGQLSENFVPIKLPDIAPSDQIRFVTGLVDSEQDAKYKVSMYAKAKQVGLPTSFVELRHEATHGDLPSLIVFRRAAERSLQWLWNDYWRYLDVRSGNLDEDELDAFKEGREKLKENFRVILRNYNEACKTTVRLTGRRDAAMPTDKVCLELVKICKNEKLVLAELVKVLLEYGMMIPSLRILGSHMDEVFPLWDSLLKKLIPHQSHFLSMLTEEMLVQLISPSMLDITIDTFREATTLWLEQIYTTKIWAAAIKRGKVDDSVVMETCLQNQNHWTVRLAVAVIGSSGHKIAREVYGDRVSKAAQDLNTKATVPIARSISIENLDRLLPSQRKWLESEEGLAEQARYLKCTQHPMENSGQLSQWVEPNPTATKPVPDDGWQRQGELSRNVGVALRKDPEESSEGLEEDPEAEGWSKWKGSWITKPIGMV